TTHDSLLTELQSQMDAIKEQNQSITDFFLALNPDTLLYKDSLGNIDLGTGTLVATGVETGILTITIADADAPAIGTATIPAGEASVMVETAAVGTDSKIYVTPTASTLGQVPYVGDITDGEKFEIKIDAAVEADLTLNWWIVGVSE
ncbi:MAG TPA: hypothetical protein VJL38_00990, partial [Patescibacteria group bacterium]|nr:hypothetical protein [Patescibacteria group bacterium]